MTVHRPDDRGHRLVYLVDWLPPEYGAIGQYALQEAEERASSGDAVTLFGLTTQRTSIERREVGSGTLEIMRIRRRAVDKSNFKLRAAWTLRTNLELLRYAAPAILRADEVLFTASPPFLEHLLVPISSMIRGKLVFRIADLHPECLMVELEHVPSWLRAFRSLAVLQRRHVAQIEVLGEDQKRLLVSQGVRAERVRLRRSKSPVEFSPGTAPAPLPADLGTRHVILYSGAVAHAHDYTTFVEGYRLHHQSGSGRFGLWLNAAGARADEFESAVRRYGLPIHRSQPVDLGQLASLLRAPAAHLITLRDEYVGLVVPSKVYACVDSGRPVLFVGSAESDVDLVCRDRLDSSRYRRVSVGNPQAVAAALESLADLAEMNESKQ